MEDIPLWLPPLPFAIVAALLLIVGIIIWFKPDDPSAPKQSDDTASH